MNKSKGKASLLFYSLLCAALLAFIIVWQLFFRDVSYYVPAAIMLVFSSTEKKLLSLPIIAPQTPARSAGTQKEMNFGT